MLNRVQISVTFFFQISRVNLCLPRCYTSVEWNPNQPTSLIIYHLIYSSWLIFSWFFTLHILKFSLWKNELTEHLKQFLWKTELLIFICVASISPSTGRICFPHRSQFAAFNLNLALFMVKLIPSTSQYFLRRCVLTSQESVICTIIINSLLGCSQ